MIPGAHRIYMDAIVYTRDDDEYNLIKTKLENEAGLIDVDRHPLNGYKRYDHIYDFIERPYVQDRLEQSIHDVIERCPNRNRWVLRTNKGKAL